MLPLHKQLDSVQIDDSRGEFVRVHQDMTVSDPPQITLTPITRGRSHAISAGEQSPRPPKRHQSLSRSRSNPKSVKRVEPDGRNPYEHVPAKFASIDQKRDVDRSREELLEPLDG